MKSNKLVEIFKAMIIEIFRTMAERYRNPKGIEFHDVDSCLFCQIFSCDDCPNECVSYETYNICGFDSITKSQKTGQPTVEFIYRARFHEQAAKEVEKLSEHLFEPGNCKVMLANLRKRLMEIDSDLYEEYLREVKNDRITI